MQSYVQGVGDVTSTDREALREKWESSIVDYGEDGQATRYRGLVNPSPSNDSLDAILGLGNGLSTELYSITKPTPKVDAYGQLMGVALRLALVGYQGSVLTITSLIYL